MFYSQRMSFNLKCTKIAMYIFKKQKQKNPNYVVNSLKISLNFSLI